MTPDEMTGIPITAFADLDRDRIGRDVDGLVDEPMRKNLLRFSGE